MEILEKKVKIACVQSAITDSIKTRLFGEVFTIIDASIVDLQSRKAVKSLISQAFTRCTNEIIYSLSNLKIEDA